MVETKDQSSDEEMSPVKNIPVKKVEDPETADRRKFAGNEALKAGDVDLAISLYTEAIELHYNEAILTNRAAAYI